MELDTLFKLLNDQPHTSRYVTKSAFSQARKQLSATAFVDLNQRVVTDYYKHHPALKTWHGFRLCAIDGSKIRLPDDPEIVAHFGVHTGKDSQRDATLGLASTYYDVLNQIVIDASLHPTTASEKECAAAHLTQAGHDLVLLDRGYNAFWLFAQLQISGVAYCMRAKVNRGLQYQRFVESGHSQATITLTPNRSSMLTCQTKGLPIDPIRVRLIRVELKETVEVLITNLFDESRYPHGEFKSLYHLRWGIEESYKRLKQWVEIENFSGKSALSVQQDFQAKILTTNLTSMMASAAQPIVDERTQHRKLNYQVNFAQALSAMKNDIVQLIHAVHDMRWFSRIQQLIKYMATSIEAVRKNRYFPRKVSKLNQNRKFPAYKRAL